MVYFLTSSWLALTPLEQNLREEFRPPRPHPAPAGDKPASPLKLIAYRTFDYNCQKLVPAARTREWMDKTPGSFAYHCLPLVMANSLGWFIINDIPCEMEWDGTEPASGLKVWATRN